MKTLPLKLSALLIGVFLFDFLFYEQSPGLNVLLFTGMVQGLVFLSRRNPYKNTHSTLFSLGFLLAGVSVALYSSFTSVLAFLGTFLIFLGFMHEAELRTVVPAGLQAGLNFFTAPFALVRETAERVLPGKSLHRLWRTLRLILIPAILLFIFITLFRFSNPVFNQLFHELDKVLEDFMEYLSRYLQIGHFVFLVFAILVLTGILFRGRHRAGFLMEAGRRDELERIRRKRNFPGFSNRLTGLKDEYKMGLVLFTAMNLLLFVVNFTEVVWLRQEYGTSSASEMSGQVHEGTGLLILSILLSILVMLVLFRRNLNFFPKNHLLKTGAYAWIVQNGLLVLNVASQNWFYVNTYGLTHLRIGVFFFLLLVMAGLWFLSLKIRNIKTTWYLIKKSTLAFYGAFLLLAVINWDRLIISYNLRAGADYTDVRYLVRLPDRNLKQLYENLDLLEKRSDDGGAEARLFLSRSAGNLLRQKTNTDWPSRSFIERRSLLYLEAHPELCPDDESAEPARPTR